MAVEPAQLSELGSINFGCRLSSSEACESFELALQVPLQCILTSSAEI